ncbi:MAG: DUF2190 domain-containing protein [Nitrospirota bacterium]
MMNQTSGIEKTVKCTAAIGTAYTIAKFGADDDTLSVASAASDELVGVFQHTTSAAGDDVRVMITGITKVVLGGTVTRGGLITADANGKGVAAAQHTHTENTAGTYTQNATTAAASAVRVIGKALASGVSGDIIPVLLTPGIA